MDGMSGLDLDQVRYAIQVAQSKGYRQVKIKAGSDKFTAVLGSVPVVLDEPLESNGVAVEPDGSPKEVAVTASAVGYFKGSLAPGEKIEVGDKIGEIVALGLANDVTSKGSGTVVEVCVADGEAVEFGQTLLLLRQ